MDHIGPLRPDAQGNMFILVLIDAFSRWVELFPTKTTTALESAPCIFQHMVVHTDRGTAFHNELVSELHRMSGTEQSLSTAYSSEENGIVERANQEVLRHLNVILFDSSPRQVVFRAVTHGPKDHEHSGKDIYRSLAC